MRASEKTRRLTGLALLTAIVAVLQVVASFVKFGPFSITLALAPILIGAALYGPKAGAYLGAVFGIVVWIACVLGWDPGGSILWTARPLVTFLLCLVKGAVAGLAAGAVFRALSHRGASMGAAILSGIVLDLLNSLRCICRLGACRIIIDQPVIVCHGIIQIRHTLVAGANIIQRVQIFTV